MFVRVGGATVTAAAAAGWLIDRLGVPNPIARAADSAGAHTTPMLVALAIAALLTTAGSVRGRRSRASARGVRVVETAPELVKEGEHVGRGQPVGVGDQ